MFAHPHFARERAQQEHDEEEHHAFPERTEIWGFNHQRPSQTMGGRQAGSMPLKGGQSKRSSGVCICAFIIIYFANQYDRNRSPNGRTNKYHFTHSSFVDPVPASLQKLASVKAQLQEMTGLCEQCSQDILAHCFPPRSARMAHRRPPRRDCEASERAASGLTKTHQEYDAELQREQWVLEGNRLTLQLVLNDLARAQSLLTQRESDLATVQSSLQGMESVSKRLGETHTTARFSLQLEWIV